VKILLGVTNISLQRIHATAPLEELLNAFNTDGGLIVAEIFPTEVISAMRDAVLDAAHSFVPGGATQGIGEAGKVFVGANTMIALEEVTEELGATRVIPGSHLWEDYRDRGNPDMTVPAELKPGDALVYSGKVVHGGGANKTSDQWRRAMHLSFLVGWLVPEESNPLDYTVAELQQQSVRVQRLLGLRSYDPQPHFGSGLWLRHANKIEDAPAWQSARY